MLAVAAWQAFVQDTAAALRDAALAQVQLAPSDADLLRAAMKDWENDFNAGLERFSTPGPDQCRTLLKRVGLDPYSDWTWKQVGGRGSQHVQVKPHHVAEVIRQWLRVRHDVAHGHATISSLPVLAAVRSPDSSAKAKAAPSLRLDDAVDCVGFFRSIVRLTAESAARHLGAPSPNWVKLPPLTLGLHVSHLKT